jgi:3-oxoacyl-[acyl-carrier protein] reductase
MARLMTDVFTPATPRRALVTGASRGIGAAVARALARDGHRVVMNYLGNHGAAERVASEIRSAGGHVELCPFDVGDADAVSDAFTRLDIARDPFTLVVNNAGIALDGPFAGMKREQWARVLRTNLDGFYNVTQPLVMPMMRQRFGRIVNLVSFSGVAGNRGQVNYGAAKAGLIGATKSLAKELASRGITVNAVCPGLIDTEMVTELDHDAYLTQVPLGRVGRPEEVAEAIRYLLSDEAAYVTGVVLEVGGGFAG